MGTPVNFQTAAQAVSLFFERSLKHTLGLLSDCLEKVLGCVAALPAMSHPLSTLILLYFHFVS